MLLHAVPAMAAVVDVQAIAHGLVGRRLQHRVDGRGDVVALGQRLVAEAGDHLLADHLGHVGRVHLDGALVRRGVHRHGLRLRRFGCAHELQLDHAIEDVVAAHLRALGIGQRIAAGRKLRNARERGHLVERKLIELLAVIELRRGRDAVGAVAEEALVQVQLEDLVLAQLALHAHRREHLGELARVAVFIAEEELARDLLGDGRTTRHALRIGRGDEPHRARDALEVDAVVLVEARVLDGEEGLLLALRDVLDRHRVAARLAEQRHQASVLRVDVHRLLHLDRAQGFHVGQLGGHEVVQGAQRDGAKQGQAGQREQRPAQQATYTGHQADSDCGCSGRGV